MWEAGRIPMEVNTNKKIGNTSEKPVFCHNAEKGGGEWQKRQNPGRMLKRWLRRNYDVKKIILI